MTSRSKVSSVASMGTTARIEPWICASMRTACTLAGERGRGGAPGRPAARPDRDAALRGDGLAGARALRPPRDRLRRARPRPVRRRRATTATTGWPPTCSPCSTTASIDRAVLAGASMGAHTLTTFALDAPRARRRPGDHDPRLRPRDATRASSAGTGSPTGLRNGGVEGFVEAYGTPNVPEKWHETIDRVLHQRLVRPRAPRGAGRRAQAVPRSRPFEDWDELRRHRGAHGRRRQPRRGRPRAPVRGRRALRGGDPERPPGQRGRGRLAAGVAGRAGLEGHRRGGGLCGSRAMSSSAHSTTSSRS